MKSVRIYCESVGDLPPDALRLLARGGLFSDPVWWRVVERHALPAHERPAYVVISDGGTIAGVAPMLRGRHRLASFTTPYTCLYQPAIQGDVTAIAAALGRFCRAAGTCRIDAVPAEWPDLPAFLAGVRQAGLVPLRFDHFGNWSEDVGGKDWPAYLAERPGALRETIRRRLRRAEATADSRFDVYVAPEDMDRAASAFESVYARSWKEPEPYPAFNVALMRALAPSGVVRMGVWSIGETPVAAQFWVVRDGSAIVLKLAHDEAFKAHSPGTVLTALMVRHLLARDSVRRIDFGRGDDAYKRGWASERRQRIGLMLANPWSVSGLRELGLHAAGRLKRLVRRPA